MSEQVSSEIKKKRRGKGCLIALLAVVVVLAVAGGIGWSLVNAEHREVLRLPLDRVDFDRLKDGTYHGVYAGGMYRWRYSECDVTVQNGKVTGIELTASQYPPGDDFDLEMLYERVVSEQSLQVDVVSGATLTSKGYLQAVENALILAEY